MVGRLTSGRPYTAKSTAFSTPLEKDTVHLRGCFGATSMPSRTSCRFIAASEQRATGSGAEKAPSPSPWQTMCILR